MKTKPLTGLLLLFILAGVVALKSNRTASTEKNNKQVAKREGREDGMERKETESGADKQMDMWLQSRGYPDPSFMTSKWMSAWGKAQFMKIRDNEQIARSTSAESSVALTGNWAAVGPKVFGGRILSLAFDPVDPNIMYAGSASGGLWKTTTGGVGANAWLPVPMNFPVLGISSILVDPTNRNTIYVGTGEVYRVTAGGSNIGRNVWKARGTYGVGILKSTNGGATWSQVFTRNMSQLFGVQKLLFNPRDPNKIYAATTDGLYRSVNAGISWIQVSNKINVRDVVVNFNDTAQVVMSVGNLIDTDKGIYRSINSGATFTKTTPTLPGGYYRGYTAFANIPNTISGNTLYASIDCGHDFYTRTPATTTPELYQSVDFGNTWSAISNSFHRSYQYWFCDGIAINPNNTSQLVLAGVDYFRLSISGTTGTKTTITSNNSSSSFLQPGDQDGADAQYVHRDVHFITYHPSVANRFYIACDGGIFETTNNGSTFSSRNGGLQVAQFYGNAAQSNTNANLFVGGLQDNGIAIYKGNATGWRNHPFGDGAACVIDQTNNNYIYIGGDARRLARSSDAGTNFTNLLTYAASDSRTSFISPMALAPSNTGVFYIASDNLHRNGSIRTATSASGQFTNATGVSGPTIGTNYIDGAANKNAISLAISPTNENKVYVSTSPFSQNTADDGVTVTGQTGLFRETNTSTTPYSFVNIKGTLPDRMVLDFAISATNDNTVFITLGGYGSSHVYRTTDGGTNWTNIDNGQLPDVPTSAIMLDPNDPNIIYVGNDLGVYVSPNGGTNWYDFNTGLWDATQVFDLVPIPGNRIRAITHGKGIFESSSYFTLLPVRTINLSGENKGSYNQLEWNVTEKINVKEYVIERSSDGIQFLTAAAVASKASAQTNTIYSYSDFLGNTTATTLFYRIKIVDNNGDVSYSKTISIELPLKGYELKVLNTIFSNSLSIRTTTPANSSLQVRLFDMQGRLHASKNISLQSGTTVSSIENISQLPKGNYLLQTEMERKKQAIKVVRQ
jgi:photosystem II stability/assembly factor-like uncharacterized protein